VSRKEREGFLWMLLAAAGFAGMPTMVKITYSHSTLTPMDIALWRFLIAVPLSWALVHYTRRRAARPRRSDAPVKHMLGMGALLSAAVLTAFFGLERMPASVYVVLFYSYPAMVLLLSLCMGDPIHRHMWLALTMALCGILLTIPDLAGQGAGDGLGVLLALANAAVVAVYYHLSKRALHGVADLPGASAWLMQGTLLVLLLLIPLRGLQAPAAPLPWLMLLGIATLGTVLPVFAINIGIQRMGAAQASLVTTAEPPMSMIIAMILLGEVVAAQQWLGAALIIGSVILLQLRTQNRLDLSLAHEAG